jgi:Domain of unknown function (DUF4189)
MKTKWQTLRNISIVALGLALSPAAFASYGAIAYDSSANVARNGHGFYTQEDAENAALNACNTAVLSVTTTANCKVMNWEQNSCIALAADGAGHWGRAQGMQDINSAINGAISACGTAACVALESTCD